MAYLGVDCSSPHLALALYRGRTLSSSSENVGRDHARRLPEALNALFAQAGLSPGDLCGVGVGVGPGSYTGLRVGVAAAKGIARSLDIPLRGESTLAAMAAGVLTVHEPYAVVALDARRGNVYAGVFQLQAGEIVQQGEVKKLERTAAQALGLPMGSLPVSLLRLPYFEAVPPDASFLARRAEGGTNTFAPLYL